MRTRLVRPLNVKQKAIMRVGVVRRPLKGRRLAHSLATRSVQGQVLGSAPGRTGQSPGVADSPNVLSPVKTATSQTSKICYIK